MVRPSAKNEEVANHTAYPGGPPIILCASDSRLPGGPAEGHHYSCVSSFSRVLRLLSHARP